MRDTQTVRTIAVSGGKGGVGKTNVAVNIALELVKNRNSVLLLDADLGMANVDIMLNLRPRRDLYHYVAGQCDLEDIVVEGPMGLDIVPAASGIGRMAEISSFEQASLIKAFDDLKKRYDVLVIDTAAGIAPGVLTFAKAAQEIVVVLCDEPASLADAYGLIKVLSREHGVKRFQILANMVRDPEHGKALFSRLAEVADNYLEVFVGYVGCIPFDENLKRAVRARKAVTQKYPYTAASIAFQKVAKRLIELPSMPGANGYVEFYVEQTLESNSRVRGL